MKKNLPEGWTKTTLEEVCNLVTDGTHEKTPLVNKENGMPLVTSKDLTDDGVCFDNVLYITKEQHKQIIKRSKAEKGDILYSKIGTIGKPTIVEVDFEFSIKNVALFKLKEDLIFNKYLRYYLLSPPVHNLLVKKAGGGNQKFIPLNKLKQIDIILPPLETQNKIISILEKAEQLKEWRKEADKLTNGLVMSIFFKMFGNQMNNSKDWKETNLGSLITHIEAGPSRRLNTEVQGLLNITSGEIQNGLFLEINKPKYIDVPEDLSRYFLNKNDLILNYVNSLSQIGKSAIYQGEYDPAVTGHNVFRIRVNKSLVNPIFLAAYFKTNHFMYQIKRITKPAVNQASFNTRDLKKCKVFLPPNAVQQAFARIVEHIKSTQMNQKQIETKIKELFNYLIQKALKGELTT